MKTKTAKKTAKKNGLSTRPAPVVVPAAPPAPVTRKAKKEDLFEVSDQSFILSIDLKRQPDDAIYATEIQDNQRLFPYNVLSRLLIGWHPVGLISSFEMRVSNDSPFPQIVVRFAEKMSPEDIKAMTPELRAQYDQNMNLVRQYPFVTVESPLLV